MTEPTAATTFTGPSAAFAVLRFASMAEARGQLRDDGIDLAELAPGSGGSVHDYWMALILLAGNKVQFTLKVFYRSAVCTKLLDLIAKDEPPVVRRRLVRDIMREYCNRTAGNAKRELGDAGLPLGLSLPLVTRGFDEVFSRKMGTVGGFRDAWQLKGSVGVVTCVADIVTSDPAHMERLAWTPPAAKDPGADDEELEFL